MISITFKKYWRWPKISHCLLSESPQRTDPYYGPNSHCLKVGGAFQALLNKGFSWSPAMEELPFPSIQSLDLPPYVFEVHAAIKELKDSKCPGPNTIPDDLLKKGGTSIVTIYKNKVGGSICNPSILQAKLTFEQHKNPIHLTLYIVTCFGKRPAVWMPHKVHYHHKGNFIIGCS